MAMATNNELMNVFAERYGLASVNHLAETCAFRKADLAEFVKKAYIAGWRACEDADKHTRKSFQEVAHAFANSLVRDDSKAGEEFDAAIRCADGDKPQETPAGHYNPFTRSIDDTFFDDMWLYFDGDWDAIEDWVKDQPDDVPVDRIVEAAKIIREFGQGQKSVESLLAAVLRGC